MRIVITAITLNVLLLSAALSQPLTYNLLPDSSSRPIIELGVGTTLTTNGQVPFWLRSNQYGSIPLEGGSGTALGRIVKNYARSSGSKKKADWGFGFDGVLNVGEKAEFIPVEAYVKGRLSIFQLKAGRSRDFSGIVDSTMSTGSFALSGNALGIPKIELSIPEFWAVPFLGDLVAFKGAISHGWMGKVPIQYGDMDGSTVKSYFHHASLFARFGKPNWKLKLLAGANHEVIWGSDKQIFGDQYNLSTLDAIWHVFIGKNYTKHGMKEDISKIGNHLGSVDLGLEFDANDVRLFAYRQQFYEKGALAYLANIQDGLTGLAIVNKKAPIGKMHWNKILLEFFYSKNQAGEENSKETPSGAEYYYNHAVYTEGYAYRGVGLGNPLITPAKLAKAGLPNAPINYFVNNRVVAFHLGTEGGISKLLYRVKLTYSQNYGDYHATDIPYWYNGRRYQRKPVYGIFQKVNQFSGNVEIAMPLANGLKIGAALALDKGDLLDNSVGGSLKVSKTW